MKAAVSELRHTLVQESHSGEELLRQALHLGTAEQTLCRTPQYSEAGTQTAHRRRLTEVLPSKKKQSSHVTCPTGYTNIVEGTCRVVSNDKCSRITIPGKLSTSQVSNLPQMFKEDCVDDDKQNLFLGMWETLAWISLSRKPTSASRAQSPQPVQTSRIDERPRATQLLIGSVRPR